MSILRTHRLTVHGTVAAKSQPGEVLGLGYALSVHDPDAAYDDYTLIHKAIDNAEPGLHDRADINWQVTVTPIDIPVADDTVLPDGNWAIDMAFPRSRVKDLDGSFLRLRSALGETHDLPIDDEVAEHLDGVARGMAVALVTDRPVEVSA